MVYRNKQEINKAIEMFNEALKIKPQDKYKAVLYKDIAYSYFLSHTKDKAIDACRKAIALNYNYADAHGYLGFIYSKDDLETNNSQKECKMALQIDPFNAISFNVLLELSRSDNQIKDYLIEKYNGLLNSYKNFSKYKIYRALGIIYLYNGMHSEAIFNLKKAKEINPYDVNINNALAVYYSELEEYPKAIKFFKIALALNPFDKSVYKNFAILYNRLNRVKEAEKLIKKSETIDIF